MHHLNIQFVYLVIRFHFLFLVHFMLAFFMYLIATGRYKDCAQSYMFLETSPHDEAKRTCSSDSCHLCQRPLDGVLTSLLCLEQ